MSGGAGSMPHHTGVHNNPNVGLSMQRRQTHQVLSPEITENAKRMVGVAHDMIKAPSALAEEYIMSSNDLNALSRHHGTMPEVQNGITRNSQTDLRQRMN